MIEFTRTFDLLLDPPDPALVARHVSPSTVRRLSHYLRILETRALVDPGEGGTTLSSRELAREAGTTAAQVRKDLSLFGSFGKRGQGYRVAALAARIRGILGLGRRWRVALLGAGRIGAALFEYADFRTRGFEIVAIFDTDPEKVGCRWEGIEIHPPARLEEVVQEVGIEIVIVAVPAEAAQEMVDRAVAAGVHGVLNFAPLKLRVPEGVSIQSVNMVMELEALSYELIRREAPDTGVDTDAGGGGSGVEGARG